METARSVSDKLSHLLSMASIAKMLVTSIGREQAFTVALGTRPVVANNSQGRIPVYIYTRPVTIGVAGQRILYSLQASVPDTNSCPRRADNTTLDEYECILLPGQTLYCESFIGITRLYISQLPLDPEMLMRYL